MFVAFVTVCLSATTAGAQTNRLTLLTMSGFPLAGSEATILDVNVGSIALGTTSFTVDLTSNAGAGFATRSTSVSIGCALPCPAEVANLQWRLSTSGTWQTLSTTYVPIETVIATFNGANDPWSRTLVWRYVLSWTGSPPLATTQFPIAMQLTVTAP